MGQNEIDQNSVQRTQGLFERRIELKLYNSVLLAEATLSEYHLAKLPSLEEHLSLKSLGRENDMNLV